MASRQRIGSGRGSALNDDIVLEAAWLYYYEGRSQHEIAGTLGVSRSSIVGYLQQARETGMVEIRLDAGVFSRHRLSHALSQRYGLAETYVVPGDTFSLERVAVGAGRRLPDLIDPGDVLGVAWGQTIFNLSQNIVPRRIDRLTVIQMVGSMSSPYGFDAEICSSHIALSLGGRCINLHAPAVLSTSAMAEALRQEPIIRAQLEQVSRIGKAVFAVGSCNETSHIVQAGIASVDDLARYRRHGAVGLVCGRFIDAAGNHIHGHLDERLIGVTPDCLRGLRMGILVSSGADKIEGIHAALRGGYATHLVTDIPTAEGILTLSR
ncbi:MAG: sugar-binding transcriptional regulator [Geminicoccaceae bacterium]|nr:sugar-binding transcriptional regulator [Geminicoccaceae bacterium]HRY23754.1 sugar-binding transcriptional regulator [Geminicoccaceae bacterium]